MEPGFDQMIWDLLGALSGYLEEPDAPGRRAMLDRGVTDVREALDKREPGERLLLWRHDETDTWRVIKAEWLTQPQWNLPEGETMEVVPA